MTKATRTREITYEALLAIERDGKQSHLVLQEILRDLEAHGAPAQDKTFVTRLVKGTVERRLLLDTVLDQFAKTKVAAMKPQIRTILRMAVYQILYMDMVPDRAAVDEAVKLTMQKGFAGLRGFVNGVCRSVVRGKNEIVYPDMETEPVKALSVRYSVGEELVEVWAARFGLDKAGAICAAFLEERPLQTIVFPNGERYVQDRSSQIAVSAAGIRPGDAVLDLCAAPGGKTLLAAGFLSNQVNDIGSAPLQAERVRDISSGMAFDLETRDGIHRPARGASRTPALDEQSESSTAAFEPGAGAFPGRVVYSDPGEKNTHTGRVLACDKSMEKVERIRENLVRCGIDNVDLSVADATVFDPEKEGRFDLVIADLPCSGFGVAGKKPEIKYKSYKETVPPLAALQRQMLAHAVRYVRPGGTLLYSTCTIAKEENEDNRAWLLETYGARAEETEGEGAGGKSEIRLQAVDITQHLPEELRAVPTAREGYLQLLPCDGPWDGFFFAVFTRLA